MAASTDTPSLFTFRPGKRTSLMILTGLGALLAGIILFDVYQDWIPEGKPLWSTLAENAIPLLLALSIPVLGWQLARTERGRDYLSEAVRWTLLGSLATLLIAGLALSFQLVQQEIKPFVFLTQITTAGAFVGLLVGYALAHAEHVPLGTEGQRSEERIPYSSVFGRRGALAVLVGIGVVLAGAILFDVYQDWAVEGKALWSTIVENIVPFLLASALPLAGWRLARAGTAHVAAAAKWTLVGCVGTLVVSSLVIGLQLLQGEIKPAVIVTQLTTVGAMAGLLIGYSFSQLRQVRSELSAREARLRGLTNSVPGVVFQFHADTDGPAGTTFVSDHAEDVLGIDAAEEGFLDRFIDRVPPPHRARLLESIAEAVDRESEWRFEMPFVRPSGETRWLMGSAAPETQKETTVFNGVLVDITDRKEAERRRKTYEELKESAEEAIVIAEEDGKIADWNAGAEDMFGYERGEILGQPFGTILPERHRRPERRGMEQVRPLEEKQHRGDTIELEGRHKDGHEIPVELSLSSWTSGDRCFFSAIIRDVTERQAAKQALQEERDRLETLFRTLPSPVVRCTASDEGFFIDGVNRAFEETFGVTASKAEGADLDALLVPQEEQERTQTLNRQILEGEDLRAEVRRRTEDGLRDFQLEVATRETTDGSLEVYALYTDVTERKARERRLDAVFNHTFQFTGLMEPDGTLIEANDTALQFGGIEEEEVLGTPLWESPWAQAGPETKQAIREAIRRARDGEFVRDEIEIQGAEENRIIDFSVRPVTDEEEDVTLLIPEGRDITERIQKEQRLQEQEAQLRGLANSIPGVVFQFRVGADGGYGFGFVGERAEELLGISAEEEGFFERFVERVPESHRPSFVASIERVVEEEAFWRQEVPFDRPDGERIWVLATSTPERRGEELVFNGVILDVTERHRAQTQLREAKEQLDTVVSNAPIILFALDANGRFTLSEGKGLKALGAEPGDVVGDSAFDLYGSYPNVTESIEAALDGEKRTAVHEVDDTVFETSYQPVRDEEGNVEGVIGVSVDITERKQRERELRRAKEEAEKAARVKTSMLANMNHELRTPLTPIKGFSESLAEELSGQLARLAERIQKSSERLASTLDAVLQLSELEAGTYELDRERVALREAVTDAAELFEKRAEKEGVELQVEADRSVVGRWNEGALRRITENLLENAIKFTPEGGEVSVRVAETDQAGLLEVEDTGVGIAEEAVPTVFESFRQESEGMDREYEGTGLGLSITDRLVDALNGSIEVATEKGEGTRFAVRLPKE